MRKLSVQSTEVKGRNLLSFLSSVDVEFINERFCVIDNPETIVIFVEFALIMKTTNLIAKAFEPV